MASNPNLTHGLNSKPAIGDTLNPNYNYMGIPADLDIENTFNGVKFVLMGGSAERAKEMAYRISLKFGISTTKEDIKPLNYTDRYALFLVRNVLTASHGMGKPSMSVCMHEITRLLWQAKASNFMFIRVGTSGGVGCNPGDVIVTERALNGLGQQEHTEIILGKVHHFKNDIIPDLVKEILQIAKEKTSVPTIAGATLSTSDFYEGQARIDGAICYHTEQDKMDWLKDMHTRLGVRNIEMEASCFVAFCNRNNIPCAILCCALLNRLKGDQVDSTPAQLAGFSDNTINVVVAYVHHKTTSTCCCDCK